MSSVRYWNQSAPFWDYVASMEGQGPSNRSWGANRGENTDAEGAEAPQPNPWAGGWAGFPMGGFPMGPFPHRFRGGPPRHHRRGPPAPPAAAEEETTPNSSEDEKEIEKEVIFDAEKPEESANETSGTERKERKRGLGAGRGGRGMGMGRGRGMGGRGGRGMGHGRGGAGMGRNAGAAREAGEANESGNEKGPGARKGPGAGKGKGACKGPGAGKGPGAFRGGMGPGMGRGGPHAHHGPHAGPHGGPFGGPHAMRRWAKLAEQFQNTLLGEDGKSDDFSPEVDIFDTPEAFVVHVSLPGAKKEDCAVSWDAEKSELNITGVVHRPGDEEFMKTLALDERKVGAFERKVRLGDRASPAQVDIEAITARMEDGILAIDVPKIDSEYVEVKKVDIE